MISKSELAQKKRDAIKLFMVNGYDQKEISKCIGISETTISKWSKKYGWREKAEDDIRNQGGLSALMNRFFLYVKRKSPDKVESFKQLWNAFLKESETPLNNQ